MPGPPPPPPPPPPIESIRIDGYEHDAAMSRSEFLTRPEVLRRRSRRCKQLYRILNDGYWNCCMEVLRSKAREYYWKYGSPFVEEEEKNEVIDSSRGNLGVNGQSRIGNALNGCKIRGCKEKPMALTDFCFMHILHDPNQKLYKKCAIILRSSASGPIHCGKPAHRSTVPCYCPKHFQAAEKNMARALKKAGVSIASTSKHAPKLHVLISEYVHEIQHTRLFRRELDRAEEW